MIEWVEETRKVSQLKKHPNNPRTITTERFETLVKNIQLNGYNNRILITKDNLVLGGNQRLAALKKLKVKEVKVLVPTVDLTPAEQDRINVTDNINAGDWSWEMLANQFDTADLIEWGMQESWLGTKTKADKESSEVLESDFSDMQHECPKCGFCFD